MQDAEYINLRIVQLIFMEKDKREFSLMSEVHEKIVFWMVRHSKTFSQLFFEQKTGFFIDWSVDE